MKRARIAVGILVVVAILTWWLTDRLGGIVEDVTAHVDNIEQVMATGGDLTGACDAMENYWYAHKNELTRYISQQRIDDITATAIRLVPLSALEEKAEFEAEMRSLRIKVEELWEAHSPSFSSLF